MENTFDDALNFVNGRYQEKGLDWHDTNGGVASGLKEYANKILLAYKKSIEYSISEVSGEFLEL